MKLGGNKNKDLYGANIQMNRDTKFRYKYKGLWKVECRDPEGNLKWVDEYENLVVNAGLDYALDVALSQGTQIPLWHIGLTSGSPTPAAADTMGNHGGWGEFTEYTGTLRMNWVDAGVSSQSADNSATTADFGINQNSSTIGGAFLTSDSLAGGGSGTLYAVGAFSGGNKSADNGDTLSVTATFTSADDGV